MTNFTFYSNPTLTLVCVSNDATMLFTLDEAASLTGVHKGLIDGLSGIMGPGLLFDANALRNIRHIQHYRRHLGVGRRALPLICNLRRQGERLEIELPFLRCP